MRGRELKKQWVGSGSLGSFAFVGGRLTSAPTLSRALNKRPYSKRPYILQCPPYRGRLKKQWVSSGSLGSFAL
ncbi:hypothetical protein FACS1894104_3980 [Actinomycetota bacterium]|nr:hypothetical protein FACS1894104_3980 [Actinomycetota bacterium]